MAGPRVGASTCTGAGTPVPSPHIVYWRCPRCKTALRVDVELWRRVKAAVAMDEWPVRYCLDDAMTGWPDRRAMAVE